MIQTVQGKSGPAASVIAIHVRARIRIHRWWRCIGLVGSNHGSGNSMSLRHLGYRLDGHRVATFTMRTRSPVGNNCAMSSILRHFQGDQAPTVWIHERRSDLPNGTPLAMHMKSPSGAWRSTDEQQSKDAHQSGTDRRGRRRGTGRHTAGRSRAPAGAGGPGDASGGDATNHSPHGADRG